MEENVKGVYEAINEMSDVEMSLCFNTTDIFDVLSMPYEEAKGKYEAYIGIPKEEGVEAE